MSFPLGVHRVIPIDCALGVASTGTEQIVILFKHVETAERIAWYGYLTDRALDRTIESLQYLGWTGCDLSDFAGGLPEGVDHEVEIVVEDENDLEGNPRRRVKWVNAGTGIAIKTRMEPEHVDVFSAKMRDRITALQIKAGGGTAPKTQPAKTQKPTPTQRQGQSVTGALSRQRQAQAEEPPPLVDDDIPF